MKNHHEQKSDSKVNDTEITIEYKYSEPEEGTEDVECAYVKVSFRELVGFEKTYDNLKEEISSNPILKISSQKFDQTYHKTKRFLESYSKPKYKTPCDGKYINKAFGIDISWKKGQIITADELFALKLYLDFDILQLELNKCTGKRLNQFFHLRRQLLMVINKFGSTHFGKYDKLYFHVTDQITMTGPLSLTSSLIMANALSEEQGMTIIIMPKTNTWKAFDATELSNYEFKRQWLIDFVCLPTIHIKTFHSIQSENDMSPSSHICKI